MKYNTQTPYAASYMIIRREGKIAFVLRQNTAWMNGYYGLPSGKVEKGESFSAAAIREAKEEIGITAAPEDMHFILTMHRNEPDEDMSWIDVYFEADKWKGEPYNAEPHMHAELVWLNPKNLPENVIPSVRAAIESIESGQFYTEYGW